MALIGKIRSKSGLAVGVIGGALLMFILAEFFKVIFVQEPEQTVHATVYGEPIDMTRVSEIENRFMANAVQNARFEGKKLTKEEKKNIKERAFADAVRRIIMDRQQNALGLTVNADELNFLIKGDGVLPPSQDIQNLPIFQDSLGRFDMNRLNQFLTTQLPQLTPEQKQEWQNLEVSLKENRANQKYVNLVARSLYVTKLEAKNRYKEQNEFKQIQFVVKKYADAMQDNSFDITDDELKAYYEEHKNDKKYEVKSMARKFKYIQIPFNASKEDFARYERRLAKMKTAFEKTKNDSIFVVNNSDSKKYNPTTMYSVGPYRPGQYNTYPAFIADSLDNLEIGGVVGPYPYGSNLCLAKKVGVRDQKLAHVRHILIKTGQGSPRSEEDAKSLSDSLISVIKANDNFVEMVTMYSEDQGSVYNGGEYKWFPEGQMVPEFNDASFNGKIGALQLVKTTYGYHIVEVLGRKDKAAQLALVFKEVKAGDAANNAAFDKALLLMNKIQENTEMFDSIAKDSGYIVKDGYVTIDNANLFNINKGKTSILKFLFKASSDVKDLSSPILTDEGMYSIFQLDSKIEEGAPDFESVKEQMRFEAKKEKIAKHYVDMLSGKGTMEQVAQAAGSEIQTAKVSFDNGNIQGVGNEPMVVGAICSGLKEGQMTIPLEGNSGVYVVLVTNVIQPQETTDYTAQKAELKTKMIQNVSGKIYQGLLEHADLKDDRKKIEFGVK